MPLQFVRRIVLVPIVPSLLRSAVLSSETANRSLFLSALGCLMRIEGNVLGFSTPVGPPSRQCVSAWRKRRNTKTSDFSTTSPCCTSITGRHRILSIHGLRCANPRCEETPHIRLLGVQLCRDSCVIASCSEGSRAYKLAMAWRKVSTGPTMSD